MAIPRETLDYYEAFSPSRRMKGRDTKEELSKFHDSLKSIATMDSSLILRQSQGINFIDFYYNKHSQKLYFALW
jgi:hypothetical protein